MRLRKSAWLALLLLAAPAVQAIEEAIDDRDVPVEIDFAACEPKEERVYVPFGSTTYQIVGPTDEGCLMRYGGEVENPSWDGFLDKTCVIPTTLGRQAFPKTSTSVDFSSLDPYCTAQIVPPNPGVQQ